MFRNIIILFSFIIYSTCFSQSGWIQQNSGISTRINSVYFENFLTGWCAGDAGKIIKTTNGGFSWFSLISGTNINLKSMSFTSDNCAFIVGDSGIILHTTDGGNLWLNLNFPNNNYNFTSVFFVNDSTGFIGGIPYDFKMINKIFKTSNKGITWDSLITDPDIFVFTKSIFFIDVNTGWIIKGFGTLGTESIYKTTNSGNNWFYQYNNSTLYVVYFVNAFIGWTSGDGSGSNVFKSTNGGNNWTPCLFCGLSANHSFYFTDSVKGWGAATGVINHTNNAGTNWVIQITNHPLLSYNSIFFTDSLTGWVVGDSGIILKTTTGGVLTGFSTTSSEIPDKYYLSQNYPNPFNPKTIINVQCSMFNYISLKVYNVLGNEIVTLVYEKKNPGSYEVEFDGSGFASGIYFYSLYADGELIDTKRMILLK